MPAYLHMSAEVSTIRAYDQAGGYEAREAYHSIVTVTHLTDKIVYLHGAVGRLDRKLWGEILDLLRERGIAEVQMERRGRIKRIPL